MPPKFGCSSHDAEKQRRGSASVVAGCIGEVSDPVYIVWWFIRWDQVRRSLREATPLNLGLPFQAMAVPERMEAGTFGIWNPVLLLPERILHRLSPEQFQAVIAHELCHVRRRDNLAAAAHLFIEALFWFHPLVWWIKGRLIEEQERACDEEVLRLLATIDARPYQVELAQDEAQLVRDRVQLADARSKQQTADIAQFEPSQSVCERATIHNSVDSRRLAIQFHR